ncbi:MAG: hypothetical protein ACRCVE_09450, partial [Plesiomonas sp.]
VINSAVVALRDLLDSLDHTTPVEHDCLEAIQNDIACRPDLFDTALEGGDELFVDVRSFAVTRTSLLTDYQITSPMPAEGGLP